MIHHADAIVLRSIEYGETSRIVTLFTRQRGKMTVIAKGARRPKSQFGSTLEPMAYTQIVYYYKPTRGVQLLKESSHAETFPRLRGTLERIGIGLRIVEMIYALLQEEEEHPDVFSLTLQVLHALDQAPNRLGNLWPFFQMQLAAMLGFAPAFDREQVEAITGGEGRLALDSGMILPSESAYRPSSKASRSVLRAFSILARADIETILRMELTPERLRAVGRLVTEYVRYHMEDAYPDQSDSVLRQLGSGDSPHS